MVDGNGFVVWEAHYDAFGKATVTTDFVANSFRLPGQYFDAESGLHYNWHRYYESETGRYMSVDPLRDGVNYYAYCSGDPLGKVDPWGTDWLNVLADFSAGAGDFISFGLTKKVREYYHSDGVNYDSASYTAGTVAGATITTVCGAGMVKAGVKAGIRTATGKALVGEGAYLFVSGVTLSPTTPGGVIASPLGGFGLLGAPSYSAGQLFIDDVIIGGETMNWTEFRRDMLTAAALSKIPIRWGLDKYFSKKNALAKAMFSNYKGAKRDFRRALKELERAAKQGDVNAQAALAGLSELLDLALEDADAKDTPVK